MKTGVVALLIVLAPFTSFGNDPPPKRHGEVTYQYDDPATAEFYRRVLDAMGIGYRKDKHEGKPVYWWLPKNDAEDAEVRGRMSQYVFTRQACPQSYWTIPSTPAGTVKRCEK